MLIVMHTYNTDEHDEQYDFAVYKMEEHEAKILTRHFNLFKVNHDSMSELCEMVFCAEDETLCEFFPAGIWDKDEMSTMPEQVEKDLDKQGWAIIPDDYEREFTPKDAHSPDKTFVVFCPEGVFWRAYPQESTLVVESQVLPREILSRVL